VADSNGVDAMIDHLGPRARHTRRKPRPERSRRLKISQVVDLPNVIVSASSPRHLSVSGLGFPGLVEG